MTPKFSKGNNPIEGLPIHSIITRPESNRQGFKNACKECGVVAYVTEQAVLETLAKGLAHQNMQVVHKSGSDKGTPHGMIAYLVRLLRAKGISVL